MGCTSRLATAQSAGHVRISGSTTAISPCPRGIVATLTSLTRRFTCLLLTRCVWTLTPSQTYRKITRLFSVLAPAYQNTPGMVSTTTSSTLLCISHCNGPWSATLRSAFYSSKTQNCSLSEVALQMEISLSSLPSRKSPPHSELCKWSFIFSLIFTAFCPFTVCF
jgi:hypothetical protein